LLEVEEVVGPIQEIIVQVVAVLVDFAQEVDSL
jgi:hypothetical protein